MVANLLVKELISLSIGIVGAGVGFFTKRFLDQEHIGGGEAQVDRRAFREAKIALYSTWLELNPMSMTDNERQLGRLLLLDPEVRQSLLAFKKEFGDYPSGSFV